MTLRSAALKVTNKLPTFVVTFIQAAVSCGVAVGLAHLTNFVGHLTPAELSIEYIPLTGVYYGAVSEAEKKWPSWTWLFYLLPTSLPV